MTLHECFTLPNLLHIFCSYFKLKYQVCKNSQCLFNKILSVKKRQNYISPCNVKDLNVFFFRCRSVFDLPAKIFNIIIIIIIIIMSRYQQRFCWSSFATPPYCPLLLAGPQGYIPYRRWAAVCKFELDVRPCEGVHRSTSLRSSSLLLQQCPACLVRLILIVFVMGGRWPLW